MIVRVWIDGVYGRTKRLGDHTGFRKQCLAMHEDDKDVLVSRVAGCSIDEGIGNPGNVCVVHVKVTAKNTPEDALNSKVSASDYTGDKLNRITGRLSV